MYNKPVTDLQMKKMDMTEKIDMWLNKLPKMTKEEADFILEIIDMDEETQAAFKFAKWMFEEEEEL